MTFAADAYITGSRTGGYADTGQLRLAVEVANEYALQVSLSGSNGGAIPVTLSGSNGGVIQVAVVSGTISGSTISSAVIQQATFLTGTFSGSFVIGAVTASQGSPAALASAWPVTLVSGSDVVGQKSNPLWVTGSVYVLNQQSGGASSNVVAQSGSVTGLLVGGQPLSSANPLPASISFPVTQAVTGSVGLSGPITGSVGVAGPVAVSNFPSTQQVTGSLSLASAPTVLQGSAPWTVVGQSGSVGGLLVGGVAVSAENPVPVSGSISVSLPSVQTVTGSVGLTAPMAVSNFPATQAVTGSVGLSGPITGTVAIASPVTTVPSGVQTVTGSVALSQGITGSVVLAQAPQVASGSVVGLLLGGVPVSAGNPIPTSTSISSATVSSGSVTGLLVGGQPLSSANPVPVTGTVGIASAVAVSNFPSTQTVTGSVGLSGPVTGNVGLTAPVAVSNFPATQTVAGTVTSNQGTAGGLGAAWPVLLVSGSDPVGTVTHPISVTGSVSLASAPTVLQGAAPWSVTAQSGSVSGLLQGGQAVSTANPIPITGSVFVLNPGGAGSNVTAQSGSVTGLLVGGVSLSSANPVPVTGSVGLSGPVTGTVSLSAPVAVSNFPASQTVAGTVTGNQGTAAAIGSPWPVLLVSGSDPVGTTTHPLSTTGSVGLTGPITGSVTLASAPQIASGSVVGLLLGGVALSAGNPLPVTGSVSLSQAVTGTFGLSGPITGSVTLASAPQIASGSVTGLLYGGAAAGATNPFFVSGTAAGVAVVSGTAPPQLAYMGFKDRGGLIQPGLVDNAGSHISSIPGFAGTRRIVGSYRAVVGPLSGTGGSLANIVNPNTGTLTVYLKQAQFTAVPSAGSIGAQNLATMIYGGYSNATLTGTTVASVALSKSFPANSTAVVTSAGSNNAVTNKLVASFLPTNFVSGSSAWTTPIINNLLDHTRESDDVCLSPGQAVTFANTGLGQAAFFYIIEFSWDEGGPV